MKCCQGKMVEMSNVTHATTGMRVHHAHVPRHAKDLHNLHATGRHVLLKDATICWYTPYTEQVDMSSGAARDWWPSDA